MATVSLAHVYVTKIGMDKNVTSKNVTNVAQRMECVQMEHVYAQMGGTENIAPCRAVQVIVMAMVPALLHIRWSGSVCVNQDGMDPSVISNLSKTVVTKLIMTEVRYCPYLYINTY